MSAELLLAAARLEKAIAELRADMHAGLIALRHDLAELREARHRRDEIEQAAAAARDDRSRLN
jgi:hypothetical protein